MRLHSVCSCCSSEADSNEIPKTVYNTSDTIFEPLRGGQNGSPVLAIPECIRWVKTETDDVNIRQGRYKLRLCGECKATLQKGVVPSNSVLAIPVNHYYGKETSIARHLSEDLISVHRELFSQMSFITRSLLALVKPILTVITVRHESIILK